MIPRTGGASEITSVPDGLGIDFSYGVLAEEVLARSTIQPDTHSSSSD
jgi:hypothetical protein